MNKGVGIKNTKFRVIFFWETKEENWGDFSKGHLVLLTMFYSLLGMQMNRYSICCFNICLYVLSRAN